MTAKHKVWRYYIRRYSSTVEAKGEFEQATAKAQAQAEKVVKTATKKTSRR